MKVDQAISLIKNANNDLPTLEEKYQNLKKRIRLTRIYEIRDRQNLE